MAKPQTTRRRERTNSGSQKRGYRQDDPRVARTLERVLESAYALLTEVGFGSVTIENISDRSGVARSTLYRHWNTRDDILRAAFSARAIGTFEATSNLRKDLRRYARVVSEGLGSVWGKAAASLAVSGLDDDNQRAVQATFINGFTIDLNIIIERAVERGEIPTLPSAERWADALLAPLFYRYLFSRRSLTLEFAEATADEVFRCIAENDRSTKKETPEREALLE